MQIEGVRIQYVFSFLFDVMPFAKEVLINGGQRKPLGDYLQHFLQTEESHYYPQQAIAWHKAEEDEPWQARSALYMQFQHLSIDTRTQEVTIDSIGPVTLQCHLALFDTGMGVMWVRLDIPRKLTSEQFQRIVQPGAFPVLISQAGQEQERRTIHQVFFSEVARLQSLIQNAVKDLPSPTQETLLSDPSQWDSTQCVLTIRWIERDLLRQGDVLWRDTLESDGATPDGVFQEPHLVMLLKIPSTDRDKLDHLEPKTADTFSNILGILHGVPDGMIDPSHGLDRAEISLHNLYPDKRFKTYLHCNHLVVLHSENWTSNDLKQFEKGLFRTFVAMRGCWHYYALTSERLDQTNEVLFQQFLGITALDAQEPSFGPRLLEKKKEIIQARGRFLRCLAIEDPLVRSVGMTAFSCIYEEGSRALRLRELRDVVREKLHELDSLYDMVNSYAARSQYELRSPRIRCASKTAMLMGLVLALLASAGMAVGLWLTWSQLLPRWARPLAIMVFSALLMYTLYLALRLVLYRYLSSATVSQISPSASTSSEQLRTGNAEQR